MEKTEDNKKVLYHHQLRSRAENRCEGVSHYFFIWWFLQILMIRSLCTTRNHLEFFYAVLKTEWGSSPPSSWDPKFQSLQIFQEIAKLFCGDFFSLDSRAKTSPDSGSKAERPRFAKRLLPRFVDVCSIKLLPCIAGPKSCQSLRAFLKKAG